jgi:hypothetical protein
MKCRNCEHDGHGESMMGAWHDHWRLRRRDCSNRADFVGSGGDLSARQIHLMTVARNFSAQSDESGIEPNAIGLSSLNF